MPQFGIFEANVLVDDVELPEYDVLADNATNTITCWIPSEAGKAFSVRWRLLSPSDTTYGRVCVDGMFARALIVEKDQMEPTVVSSVLVATTVSRPLMFSALELTDDDTFLHSVNVEGLGDIRLELWTISVEGESVLRPVALPTDTKVHEKSKKGMAHRVGLGDEKVIQPVTINTVKRLNRLGTFIFKYRSIDILRADGIAPLDPASQKSPGDKRKLDVIEIQDDDEGEDDEEEEQAQAELKLLLERTNEIQSLLAKKAGKSKVKNRKKVKSEHHSDLIPGEVIDLT